MSSLTAHRSTDRRPFEGAGGTLCRCLRAAGLLLALLWLPGAARAMAAEPTAGERIAIVADIDGAIGPATANYLSQVFAAASERRAAAIVLRMDTPGGLASSMREIIRAILASPVPVLTFVAPSGARAASAGTYILYASHIAAMAPGTNLGAATPVAIGGGLPLPGAEKEKDAKAPAEDPHEAKAVNDAAAYIRGLAELRHRNVAWAEEAVRKAASLSATEAEQQQVIDFIATDLADLFAKADGRPVNLQGRTVTLHTAGLTPVVVEAGWRARLLGILTDPNIAYLLLLIGLYGIIFEFISPGGVAPGVVGSISLLVGLFALNLLPLNYAGMGLLLLGVALLVAEAFAPSFGVLGIGGIAAFALGSLFLFDEAPGFVLSPAVVITATAVSAGLLAVMLATVIRAHRHRLVSGGEALLGASGTVLDWGGEGGDVQLLGERWQARAARPGAGPFSPGSTVTVCGREGLTLLVDAASGPAR